jgi:hypothetical protein
MVKRILISLAVAMITNAAVAASENDCWDKWHAEQLAIQPKSDDTVDPRTGKSLSQTDGAKRSRAQKLQALKDSLALRGKDDEKWKSYRAECLKL